MESDAELLRRYSTEDSEAAFAELVGRHLGFVYATARRMVGGDSHRAQDVAQIVFTSLARKAGSLTNHGAIGGWLYQTTRFVSAQLLRTERRRLRRDLEAHVMIEKTAESETGEWGALRPHLDELLAELSVRDRDIVVARFFYQQPFAAISEAFGVDKDTAKKRAYRALEKLRAGFARRGVTSSASAVAALMASESALGEPVTFKAAEMAHTAVLMAKSGAPVSTLGGIKIALLAVAAACVTLIVVRPGPVPEAEKTLSSVPAVPLSDLSARARLAADFPVDVPVRSREALRVGAATDPAKTKIAHENEIQEAHKMRLRDNYSAFIRENGMTEEQAAAFVELLSERASIASSLREVMSRWDAAVSPAMREEAERSVIVELDRKLAALLQTELAAVPLLLVRAELAQRALSSGHPFSRDQTHALDEILRRAAISDSRGSGKIDWVRVVAEAKPLFSTAQWEQIDAFRSATP